MSASRTKKERQAAAAAGLTQKQLQEQNDAKKKKRNAIIYTVCGIVAAVAVIVLLVWDSGVIQKHSKAITVGDTSYTVAALDYFYYIEYANYSSYASMYGMDTSVDLKEQEVYEGYTWHDMLTDAAIADLTQTSVLAQEARAAGYELSEDGQAAVEAAVSSISTYAELYGATESYYLQASYGKYMTMKAYRDILTEVQLANEFGTYKRDSFEITDADIDNYYAEHSADYDTIDYNCYLLTFARTTTDDEGNSIDLDDAAIEANRAEAQAKAQEILDALDAGDTDAASTLASDYGASDDSNLAMFSYYGFGDWLSDAAAGDSALVDYTSGDNLAGYYAIRVNDRTLDEYHGANIHFISLSAETDDDGNYDMDAAMESLTSITDEFEGGDKTVERFAALANENSSTASSYPDGLRENVSKTDFNDEITEWLFDNRAAGDYQMFSDADSGICYLILFDGYSDAIYWRTQAESDLRDESYSTWQTETTENYETVNGAGLRYLG